MCYISPHNSAQDKDHKMNERNSRIPGSEEGRQCSELQGQTDLMRQRVLENRNALTALAC